MMKISVITVCKNTVRTIDDTIKSVLSQNYQDVEYIVVDGASTDGTLEMVNKYRNKISKIVSEPDNSMYEALNKGIKIATGEIIGFLNADDVYAGDNILSRIVKRFEETKTDSVWGDLFYVNKDDVSKTIRTWESSEYASGKFQNGWMPPHPCFYAKKSCYENYGYFREDIGSVADYELMLRFLEKNKINSSYIQGVMVKMRVGGISNRNIKNIIKAKLADYRAWKINGLKVSPLVIFFKPLSKIGQYFKKYK